MTRNRVPDVIALLRAAAPDASRAAVAVDLMAPMELADKLSAEPRAVARARPARRNAPRVIRQRVRR